MFTFTWIDTNCMKHDLPVKGIDNALTMYNILHDKAMVHNLRCLMKDGDYESYIVFVNNVLVKV